MYLKLQHNFLVFIITIVLLSLGGQSFSQDSAAENQPEENHDTKDLEQLLKRYNTDAEKVLNDANKLHKEEVGQEVDASELESMRPSGNVIEAASKTAFKKAVNDREKRKQEELAGHSDYSGAVRLALAPLQKLSEKELLKQFDENSKNSSMRPYFDQFPKVVVFAVKLIKDQDSLPFIAKIAENRQQLTYFLGVMLATIIFGFMLKKVMHREGRSFLRATFYFLLRMNIMFAIRIFIIYYFYSNELTPAARVFKETFL